MDKSYTVGLQVELTEIIRDMKLIDRKVGSGTPFDNADLCNALRDVAWGVKVLSDHILTESIEQHGNLI